MFKSLVICSIVYFNFFNNSVHAQNGMQINIASDIHCVNENNPIVNVCCSVTNYSKKKIAIHSPDILNIGKDSKYSWNLYVTYNKDKKCIPTLRLLSWKELNKYVKIKPHDRKSFSFKLNFKELISENLNIENKLEEENSISNLLYNENTDFGKYQLVLKYFDQHLDNKYAVQDTICSNKITMFYYDEIEN